MKYRYWMFTSLAGKYKNGTGQARLLWILEVRYSKSTLHNSYHFYCTFRLLIQGIFIPFVDILVVLHFSKFNVGSKKKMIVTAILLTAVTALILKWIK